MSKKSTLKIAKFIVFIACLIHLLNFLLGGAISVYNYVIPKYFSLVISVLLAFVGYNLHKLTNGLQVYNIREFLGS